jgi:2'-5' RNA ligase superfamily
VINSIRRQLTAFVEQKDAENIEHIRQAFNPRQYELIKSHVTVCREDEITELEHVIQNLTRLTHSPHPDIVIEFGRAMRFDNGNGVLLPAKRGIAEFQELRRRILRGVHDNPRHQEPHITLLHPRNSTCTDDIFAQIEATPLPTTLALRTVSLIEQVDGGRWETLQEYALS